MPRSPKVYRGSRKRVQRIRLRHNWSAAMWIVVLIALAALIALVPM